MPAPLRGRIAKNIGYILHRRTKGAREQRSADSDMKRLREELTSEELLQAIFDDPYARKAYNRNDFQEFNPVGERGEETLRANYAAKFALQKVGIRPPSNEKRDDPFYLAGTVRFLLGQDTHRKKAESLTTAKEKNIQSFSKALRADLGEREFRRLFGRGTEGDEKYKRFIQYYLRYYRIMQRIPLQPYSRRKN